jgi:hypothetical protein
MGCLYAKKEGFCGGELPHLAISRNHSPKKTEALNRVDTCSTVATTSARATRLKLIRKLLLDALHKENKFAQHPTILGDHEVAEEGLQLYWLQPVFPVSTNYEVRCDE